MLLAKRAKLGSPSELIILNANGVRVRRGTSLPADLRLGVHEPANRNRPVRRCAGGRPPRKPRRQPKLPRLRPLQSPSPEREHAERPWLALRSDAWLWAEFSVWRPAALDCPQRFS